MKKDWLMLMASTGFAVALGLGLIKWLAPGLLGTPPDLQVVRVAEKLPPFFAGVFATVNPDAFEAGFLKDPLTRVRGIPQLPDYRRYGPHDILGFRNLSVPSVADVITIGDSQTYGNNAATEETWPGVLQTRLRDRHASVYSMATGGWGPIEYLQMAHYAFSFQPRVIVVAFYTGNDAFDALNAAKANDKWSFLTRELDEPLQGGWKIPATDDNAHTVVFPDGGHMTFTPATRLVANDRTNPLTRAGYEIAARAAEEIAAAAQSRRVRVVFTIIPTKEFVFAPKIAADGISMPAPYRRLIEMESENIENLTERLESIGESVFVDIVAPLQQQTLSDYRTTYPPDADGHPVFGGYRLIAETLSGAIREILPPLPDGLIAIRQSADVGILGLATPDGLYVFDTPEVAARNGWSEAAAIVEKRDVAALPRLGIIRSIDPARFGPDVFPSH